MISPAASALPTMAAGKLISKKNPQLGALLHRSGKHLLSMYNPKSIKKVLRYGNLAINEALAKKRFVDEVEHAVSKRKLSNKLINNAVDLYKMSKNPPVKDLNNIAEKTFAFIGGTAAAGLGGGINMMSADLQYRTGRNMRKKADLCLRIIRNINNKI